MKLLNQFTLTCTLASALSASAQQAERPNIILIMTDQQSFNAISAHADLYQGTYCSTPNIDRIANEGTSFTRAYCTNPVSVPSRFSLFTGKYGGQYGIRDNASNNANESEVRTMLTENGMGFVFEKGGYDTYYGGKVHLPFSAKTGTSKFAAPAGYGFGNYYSSDERAELGTRAAQIISEKAKQKPDKPFLLVASFLNPHDICLESSTNLSSVVEDKGGKKQPITECVRDMRARAAAIDSIDFYKNHAPGLPANFAKTSGFPELNKSPYKDFPEWYWRKYRWTYSQLVSLVDSHIGDILDALDQNPDLKKNTIIVFTSDHGEMQGAHQTVTKSLPYEECQRVPMIFAGPGIRKGKRNSSLVCNGTDLLPTLCTLAGIPVPVTDGLQLADLMKGKEKKLSRETLYLEGTGFLNALDEENKYTLFDGKDRGEMLVNLAKDKGELHNVIDSDPKTVQKLQQVVQTEEKKAPATVKDKSKGKNKDGKKDPNKVLKGKNKNK